MERADIPPYLQSSRGSLPTDESQQTLPSIVIPDDGSPENDIKLLYDIFRKLQRMETLIEGQDKRLITIETSIQPERFGEGGSYRAKFGTAQTSQGRASLGPDTQYRSTIQKGKMKMMYEFEESISDLEMATSELKVLPTGNYDPDAYSLSEYTVNMLDLDHIQASVPSAFSISQLKDISRSPYEGHTPHKEATTAPSEVSNRPSSEESWKTASSGRSKASHENVELTFYAYNNWKHGVLAKIRNGSNVVHKAETERLRGLMPSQESRLLSLRGLFFMVKRVLQSKGSNMISSGRIVTVVF